MRVGQTGRVRRTWRSPHNRLELVRSNKLPGERKSVDVDRDRRDMPVVQTIKKRALLGIGHLIHALIGPVFGHWINNILTVRWKQFST
jgi:hypothetical protein